MSPRRSPLPSPSEPSGGHILLRFPHPEPPRPTRRKILPVFLPFAGCPQRCIFCDQAAQTGQTPQPLEDIHARLEAQLAELPATADPPELAFYGGTFTALPAPWPRRFVALAGHHLASGRLSRIRCSTRPDAVDPAQLAELKALGLSLVELGVQSFDDAALLASRRGYGGATVLAACAAVREAGLGLGIQLMPGLPGHTPEAFRADVAQAAALRPELARLYPCLVLEGTPLAALWRAGGYAPWELEATVDALALALLELWAAGVPTARMGLAEQEGLAILAGPRHPALGQLARGRALLRHVAAQLTALPEPAPSSKMILNLPRRLQGEALGQKNALAPEYAALGLALRLWDEPDLALCAE
ncbi:elongator complex protein 3 [Humidesulfovibrio sp.]|uniref:elongator complex protein 3 n=1 Tax=Humidesulfovibrio sp. TaxID=2910988 RepID=UPI002D7FBF2F|nr:radical SAM protein [Humidesulfovibrio sp.]